MQISDEIINNKLLCMINSQALERIPKKEVNLGLWLSSNFLHLGYNFAAKSFKSKIKHGNREMREITV